MILKCDWNQSNLTQIRFYKIMTVPTLVYEVLLLSNKTDVKTCFNSTNYKIKMLSPQCTPLLISKELHMNAIVESNATHHLIAYSFALSLLPSLHLQKPGSDQCKFNFLKKNLVSIVAVPTQWSCASPETSSQTGCCVLMHCLGRKSMNFFFETAEKTQTYFWFKIKNRRKCEALW